MKGLCHDCGLPLYQGNVKIVRPRGKKRPYRIHRRCPAAFEDGLRVGDKWKTVISETAGSPVQRPQDSTGGPLTATVVFQAQEPPRFRYFMTRDQAERVRAAIERHVTYKMGVSFEVIPVPADQVENDPEAFDDLVEVTVDWKVE